MHIEIGPVQVLLPRDLHMGDPVFEELKDRQQVEFEVVGSRFQQGDSTIAVLGKLKTVVQNAPLKERAEVEEPMLAAPTSQVQGSQKVVTVAPTAPTVPRKRKLNPSAP